MSTTAVDPVVAQLVQRGETLATAESLTGGLLGAMLTAVAGVSAVYRGGIIAYATDLKRTLLQVSEEQLCNGGPVDAETAVQMARGARVQCGADWGLATTGVAGPDSQDGKPVGMVYLAMVGASVVQVRELALTGNRKQIRAQAARSACELAADCLAELSAVSGENSITE